MHSILKKIVADKKREVEMYKKLFPLAHIIDQIGDIKPGRDFKKAISKNRLTLIAEIKRASPSKGELVENFNPEFIAKEYKKVGVDAVSVLTERNYFKGDLEYLRIARKCINVPILRKDFITDEYQLYGAKLYGADAILLICAILPTAVLKQFVATARKLKLNSLIEVHSKEEIQSALDTGADIIGINNRDLNTFTVDLKTTEKLVKFIPKNKIVVSESGIKTREDIIYMKELGVNSVLIGETLMRSKNIPQKVKELLWLE